MVTLSGSNNSANQYQHQQPTSSLLLNRRIRSIIFDLNSANTERVVAELASWIGLDQEPDPSLLEFVSDTVVEDITERLNKPSSDLARLSYGLSGALPTYSRILQTRLQSQFLESAQFLANHRTAEQGSWPELVALVAFVGELCSLMVIPPAVLLDVYLPYLSRGPDRSELELEAICALFKAAGTRLWNDPHTSEVLTREMEFLQGLHDQIKIPPFLSKKLDVSATRKSCPIEAEPLHFPQDLFLLHSGGWIDSDCSLSTSLAMAEEPGETPFVNPDIRTPFKCNILPKHPEFYLTSADIVLVCRTLLFRVHSDHLSRSSTVFTDMIEKSKQVDTHKTDGCLCIHIYEEPEDFSILLQVLYNPG